MPAASRTLLAQLAALGCRVETVPDCPLALVSYNGRSCLFTESYTPLVPEAVGIILTNRQFVREICADAKISVPEWKKFNTTEISAAQTFAGSIGYPVVIRLTNARQPVGMIVAESEAVFRRRFNAQSRYARELLVERYVHGTDLRVFADTDDCISILGRKKETSAQYDATDTYAQTILPLARNILLAFAPITSISFGLRLSEDGTPWVTGVTYDASPHYEFPAYRNGKRLVSVAALLTSRIASRIGCNVH